MMSKMATPKDSHTYSGKEVLKSLPPGNYVVRLRAKNLHGWSHFSTEEIFNGGEFLFRSSFRLLAFSAFYPPLM